MGKIYVDEIEKSAEGTGIQLNSPLLNNSGNELLSAAGALSGNVDLSSIALNSISGDKLNLSVSSFAENTMQYYEIGNIRYAYGYVTTPGTSIYVGNYGTTYYNYTPFTYVTNFNSIPLVIGATIQNINYEDSGSITLSSLPQDQGGGTYKFNFLMRSRGRNAAIHSVKVAFIIVGEKYVG